MASGKCHDAHELTDFSSLTSEHKICNVRTCLLDIIFNSTSKMVQTLVRNNKLPHSYYKLRWALCKIDAPKLFLLSPLSTQLSSELNRAQCKCRYSPILHLGLEMGRRELLLPPLLFHQIISMTATAATCSLNISNKILPSLSDVSEFWGIIQR